MRVEERFLDDKAKAERDYRDAYEIYIDGDLVASFWDGEPEDANLARDFNDCYSIVDIMRHAYNVGKSGGTFEMSDGVIEYE